MPRERKIRWRENDLNELRRLAKNYNAKIARQRKKLLSEDKRYRAAQLPEKVSVRELRSAIGTRAELKKELERMQNFIDTGNKFVVDTKTKKSLHATVRDFNTKIDKLAKKAKTQGEKAALPEKISSKELLQNAASKESLLKDLKDYKAFLKPGAEELVEIPDTKFNIKLTKWQKDTMNRRLVEINKNREKELEAWKATEVKYGGKEAGYTHGEVRMDKGDFDEFQPLTSHSYSSTYRDMREKFKLVMRESQDEYWKARTELARINYTEKLDRILGDHPIGKMLLKKIKSADLDDFKRVLKSEDDLFLLLYDIEKNPDNYDSLLEELWNEWSDEDMYEALDEYLEGKGA